MDREVQLTEGVEPARRETVLNLLRDYEASIPISLEFQDFDQELAAFPAGYEPPDGTVILALGPAIPDLLGLVCIRRLSEDCCEMKRLYVTDAARGLKLGRRLAVNSIEKARALGYRRMRLDTLESMTQAIALYRSLGFSEIPNYNENPVPGSLFFEYILD